MADSRIMVVEGSSVARELITRILGQQIDGAEITACANADEALRHLDQQHYNLITTSLLLEDMDGLELCRQIRKGQDHHYTPIIVISGDADSRLLKEGFAAGVTDYFDKSLGYPAFGEFIKEFCQRNTGLVGRVLFVEDSRTAAVITTRMLERHGLQVIHTASAEEALEMLRRVREDEAEPFDMVITDFHLVDDMTGGDLLYAVRTRLKFSQQELPVLIITGNDDQQTQVEVFHAGANDFVNKPLVDEILMARVRSLLLIKQQYGALKRQARDMERLANSDTLTRTYNRRFLFETGNGWVNTRQPLGVMLMDIDHFKSINDNHGHQTGDHVLTALGGLLNQQFGEQGLAARYGGEEFAVLLPEISAEALEQQATELRQAISDLKPDGLDVSASIGICHAPEHPGSDLETLLNLADQALYAAKEGGRNRVCLIEGDRSIITVSSVD